MANDTNGTVAAEAPVAPPTTAMTAADGDGGAPIAAFASRGNFETA